MKHKWVIPHFGSFTYNLEQPIQPTYNRRYYLGGVTSTTAFIQSTEHYLHGSVLQQAFTRDILKIFESWYISVVKFIHRSRSSV